jgi:hypothetical protein
MLNLKPAKEKEAPVKPVAKAPVLESKRLQDEDFVRRGFRASVPAGVTWQDVLAPAFWTSNASRLQPGDIIECVRDDLAYYGRVVCTSALGSKVTVHPLEHVEIDPVGAADFSERSGFAVENRGLTDKFVIVRLADSHVMRTGLESAEQAHEIIRLELIPRYRRKGFG